MSITMSSLSSLSSLSASSDIDLVLDLTRSIHRNCHSNFILSPYSLVTALTMLIVGARGKSRQELAHALLGTDVASCEEKIESLLDQISSQYRDFLNRNSQVFHQANLLYGQQDLVFNVHFIDKLLKGFMAKVKNLDFQQNAPLVVMKINEDVAKESNGLINHIVETVDDSIALLIINAIHFKDQWAQPFHPANSQQYPFELASGQTVQVNMMQLTACLPFCNYESLGLSAVRLNYKMAQNTSMLILLPNNSIADTEDIEPEKKNSIAEILTKLNTEHLRQILLEMEPIRSKVRLVMPRFTISSTHDLTPHLRKMNIRSVLEPDQADLTGILDEKSSSNKKYFQKLYVSQVIQKAVIEVNEQGTEAAAVTKVAVRTKRSCEMIEEMICDRPFIFLIIDADKSADCRITVLFTGLVQDPSQ